MWGNEGAKLENLVALGIKKQLSYLEDVLGHSNALYYLRNKESKEIDFCIEQNRQITHLIEVKWSDVEDTP